MSSDAATSSTEYESSIHINLKESEYNKIVNFLCRYDETDNVVKHDYLLFFNVEGESIRLSQRNVEIKRIRNEIKTIGVYDGKLLPIIRTNASETLTSIPDILIPNKISHRTFINTKNNVRVSCNKSEREDGIKFTISVEKEYVTSDYAAIIEEERDLMRTIMSVICDSFEIDNIIDGSRHIDNLLSFKELELQKIFSCIPPKLQTWNCLNKELPYVWAYKWNGCRAKMVYGGDGNVRIWPDASNIIVRSCSGDNLSLLNNICVQIEIMDGYYILTGLIAISCYNNMYMSEPIYNLKFLKHIYKKLKNVTIGGLPMYIQKYFNSELPTDYDANKYDGFVVIQNQLLIKWKKPTVDLKCVGKDSNNFCTFVVGDNIKIPLLVDTNVADKISIGDIVEVDADTNLLRIRRDRTRPSTNQEWLIYQESVRILNS